MSKEFDLLKINQNWLNISKARYSLTVFFLQEIHFSNEDK